MDTIQSFARRVETPSAALMTAWGTILMLTVPQIIYAQIAPLGPGEPTRPLWLAGAQVAVLATLWLVTWLWSAVKPLRGFFLVLIALYVGLYIIVPLAMDSFIWENWVIHDSWGVWLVADTLGMHLMAVVLMTLTLIGSGIGRREMFLARGDPGVDCQPTRLLLTKKPEPWPRFVRRFLVVFVIIVVVVPGIQMRPDLSQISQALIFFPAILIASAINAFAEEYEFRSALLPRLLPAFGKQQAIMITAVFWGVQNYFGYPGGLGGVFLVSYLGYIFAKSMIETRGIVWAFLIHFIGDVIIYAFWAMAI